MTLSKQQISNAANYYEENGYVILPALNGNQIDFIKNFAKNWLYRVIAKGVEGGQNIEKLPLEKYHLWWQEQNVNHVSIFGASNRYINPEGELRDALLNKNIWAFLDCVSPDKLELWSDPGLGWMGFRFIRPGMSDGYPTSCKAWGAANQVISCWVPIIGHSSNETIALVPGSHKKKYEHYLPTDQKFTSGEFRLKNTTKNIKYIRPDLKCGDVILFHPRTLHTEDVIKSDITRLNLEYRFNPIS